MEIVRRHFADNSLVTLSCFTIHAHTNNYVLTLITRVHTGAMDSQLAICSIHIRKLIFSLLSRYLRIGIKTYMISSLRKKWHELNSHNIKNYCIIRYEFLLILNDILVFVLLRVDSDQADKCVCLSWILAANHTQRKFLTDNSLAHPRTYSWLFAQSSTFAQILFKTSAKN
jgi:hypothetical protein